MGEVWIWDIKWVRDFELLNNLMQILNNYRLKRHEEDRWWWNPSPIGEYSTGRGIHKDIHKRGLRRKSNGREGIQETMEK